MSHDRALLEGMTRISSSRRRRAGCASTRAGGASSPRSGFGARTARSTRTPATSTSEPIQEQTRRMRAENAGTARAARRRRRRTSASASRRSSPASSRSRSPGRPGGSSSSCARPAPGDVVARLERGGRRARASSRLGPIDLGDPGRRPARRPGRNGAGKTTLLRRYSASSRSREGRRWVGPGVVLGALPQGGGPSRATSDCSTLFLGASDLDAGAARTLLAKFALGADDVLRPGALPLPGERSRATLALLAARGVNTLVLDEPTNHLDLEAIVAARRGSRADRGTVVPVTHHRRLLEAFRRRERSRLDGRRGRALVRCQTQEFVSRGQLSET